ncbi:hypothetical protein AB4Y45_32305 [Paraburkholderia sp. EG287A]|uniref:hypothetical protein n=1 Tax=Paraburkholderia sp. EG287A TaxID=3237012 RepID=UPI0034D2574D
MRNVVQQRVDHWRGHKSFAWAGECGIFADYVFHDARAKGLSAQLDSFDDDLDCWSRVTPPPGVTVPQLRELGLSLNHVWVVLDSRHYDAASPAGVDNPLDLLCARLSFVEELRRKSPDLLRCLTRQFDWWRTAEASELEFQAIFKTRDAQYEEN